MASRFTDTFWPPSELGMGSPSRVPVFIVGFFRSGSTLLETMLAAHPNIDAIGEDSPMPFHIHELLQEIEAKSRSLHGQATASTSISTSTSTSTAAPGEPDGVKVEAGGTFSPPPHERLPYQEIINLRAASVLEHLESLVDEQHYDPDIASNSRNGNLKSEQTSLKDKQDSPHRRIVDKMLPNYSNIAYIRLLFPNAVIINTIRDPLDNLLSCMRIRFSHPSSVWSLNTTSLVNEYTSYLKTINHFRRHLPVTGKIIDVSYEALASNPERVIKEVRWIFSLFQL
jgi:Sulfotransferase family